MKKHFSLIICCLFWAFVANAQPEKGTRTLGGLFKIENTETDLNSNNKDAFSGEIAPSYSVFIADKLAIGTRLGYGYSRSYTTTSAKAVTSVTHSVPISVFVQYYHWFSPQIGLTVRGGVSYRIGFLRDDAYTISSQKDTISLGTTRSSRFFATPSLVVMPSKNIAIELSATGLEYGNDARLDRFGTAYSVSNVFRFNLSSSLALGAYYYF